MKNVFFALGTILVLAITISVLPLDKINWGRISILPAATITVTGTSQSDVTNKEATFNASVTYSNPDKQTAINYVNTKMTALIAAVKDFGINDTDIKTDNVNVYQMPVNVPQTQTAIYPVPPVPNGTGDWQASNSITITLKDVTKASALSDLLNKSGATNVYGPNLSTGSDTTATDAALLTKAVADAKTKAEAVAKSGGQTLGKMINVQENGSSYPVPMFATKDTTQSAGSPIQTGTTTLSKSVTVVFELK